MFDKVLSTRLLLICYYYFVLLFPRRENHYKHRSRYWRFPVKTSFLKDLTGKQLCRILLCIFFYLLQVCLSMCDAVFGSNLQTVACIKPSNHNQVFNLSRLILVAPATNAILEPFPWLALNRSRNTCLALQCIRVVVCSSFFSIKYVYFRKLLIEIPQKMFFHETFDVNYYHYHYCYCIFIPC